MNVDGYITLESAKDALTIPSGALMRGNKVYVKDTSATQSADASGAASSGDGLIPAGFKEVTVTTGVINSDFVQITSGLNEGDEVYVDESASMDTGTNGMGGMGGEGAPAEGGGADTAGAGGAGADAGGADAGAGGE